MFKKEKNYKKYTHTHTHTHESRNVIRGDYHVLPERSLGAGPLTYWKQLQPRSSWAGGLPGFWAPALYPDPSHVAQQTASSKPRVPATGAQHQPWAVVLVPHTLGDTIP